eukprot:TRINITY_DN7128_c0_g2_i2.p1 TRINITY_DN7128_c0_g2~~TRINITY_DN7128_c0_g2_i2.p1  ORF type:complete len:233 (-),score=27.07 TRINITY_DN7128_c0_g2_i2:3-701(-)
MRRALLTLLLFLCFMGLVNTFRCSQEGKCVEDENYTYSDGNKPDIRCTREGNCETDNKRFETRVSATGQELKDKALRLMFEVWTGNDFSHIEEFISPSHVFSSPMLKRPLLGVNGLKSYVQMTQSSFSEYSYFIDDIIQESNTVVIRYQFFGTNIEDFNGIPAGKFVKVTDCVAMFTFWQSKIQQSLVIWPREQLQESVSSVSKTSEKNHHDTQALITVSYTHLTLPTTPYV